MNIFTIDPVTSFQVPLVRNTQSLILVDETATKTSNIFYNPLALGGVFLIDIANANTGSPTLTVDIMGVSPNGQTYTILSSAALSTPNTVTPLYIYPGMTTVANSVADAILPYQFKVKATLGGTGSFAGYSISSSAGFNAIAGGGGGGG